MSATYCWIVGCRADATGVEMLIDEEHWASDPQPSRHLAAAKNRGEKIVRSIYLYGAR